MVDKDFDASAAPGADDEDEVFGGKGSGAHAPGPASHDDPDADADGAQEADEEREGGATESEGLTVDDILAAAQNPDAAAEDAKLADLESALLTDLKRLQAEYANYRRRTEEQREQESERAKGAAIKPLLPVLDDLDRAEKHGDLDEGTPFAAIAEKVRGIVERMGVTTYGAAGEPFDPQQHEAIFQSPTPGVTTPTILEVVETGYRLGSTELRPAKVVVAVPVE